MINLNLSLREAGMVEFSLIKILSECQKEHKEYREEIMIVLEKIKKEKEKIENEKKYKLIQE